MLIVTPAAIAVVKADQRKPTRVATASEADAASQGGATSAGEQPDATTGAGPQGPTGAGGAGAGATTAAGSPSGPANGARATKAAGGTAAGGGCKDYNPDQGVYCDHILAGGTTVLSGPLAVYGDQGLKAGLAWQTYYNTEIAPREHLRQAKLIWYDDSLDPQKTLQYVHRRRPRRPTWNKASSR